ncbi:MAG TPA: acyl-CoA dehydrogenase family protein [Solirubrobacteraceae bacterium]|nr:acyl-CoA dehydrogenase family protein [Solirubrobacteraceae bacterium]
MWEFSTEPEFAAKLEWALSFMEEEVYPLETLEGVDEAAFAPVLEPLREQVKSMGLWAAHLTPEYGGQGYGSVQLGLLAEITGRSSFGATVFGSQAPDAGNAELIAVAGDEEQRQRWLEPLLAGRLKSAFSMTEPEVAGSDPTLLQTHARKDGAEWVIDGHKWFTSNGSVADFLIAMVVTDPDAAPHKRASMIIVPTDAQGLEIVRDTPTMEDQLADPRRFRAGGYGHAEIVYDGVRVPESNLLGQRGAGFELAQLRLGPGRIQHCMRWLGQSQRAFDMLCERAVSRFSHGSLLSEKGTVRDWVAESAAELLSARLMTLFAAWKLDTQGLRAARQEISMIKFHGARVLYNVIDRAIQVHGALGFSTDMPLESMYRNARAARLYDGPDEVHRQSVSRRILAGYTAADPPSEHIPTRRQAAQERFGDLLGRVSADL